MTDHYSIVEQQYPVGVLGGKREIVECRDHGHPSLPAQLVDQIQNLRA